MAYPYKKMTSEDFDYIRSVTASDRVWVGDEIAKEYYRDEMPEYGVFPPELYVEVLNKEEISAIMAYAYKENIPVVCRGAGTGLAGGATCKYGGIMLSVMRMNRIFPIDRKNQTITAEPGALLIDIQAAAAAGGLFYPPDPGEKTAYHKCGWYEGSTLWTDKRFCALHRSCHAGWIDHEFFIQCCKKHHGIRCERSGDRIRGNFMYSDTGNIKAASCTDLHLYAGHAV